MESSANQNVLFTSITYVDEGTQYDSAVSLEHSSKPLRKPHLHEALHHQS